MATVGYSLSIMIFQCKLTLRGLPLCHTSLECSRYYSKSSPLLGAESLVCSAIIPLASSPPADEAETQNSPSLYLLLTPLPSKKGSDPLRNYS